MAASRSALYEFARLAHFRRYCCCNVDYNKWDELCAEQLSAEGFLVHQTGYCCCHFKAQLSADVPSIAAKLSKALDQRTSESNLPPSSAVGVEGNHDGDNNAAPRVDPESNAETAVSDAAADLPVRVSSTESDNDDRPTLVTRNTSSEQQSQLEYATGLSTDELWEDISKWPPVKKTSSKYGYKDMLLTPTNVVEQLIERHTKRLILETSELREEKGKFGALLEQVLRDTDAGNIINSTLRTEIEGAVGVHHTNPSLDLTEAFQETNLAEQPDAPGLQVVGSSMPKNVETDMRDATSKPATWQENRDQEHQPFVISNAVVPAFGPLRKSMFTVVKVPSSFRLDILQAENLPEALSSEFILQQSFSALNASEAELHTASTAAATDRLSPGRAAGGGRHGIADDAAHGDHAAQDDAEDSEQGGGRQSRDDASNASTPPPSPPVRKSGRHRTDQSRTPASGREDSYAEKVLVSAKKPLATSQRRSMATQCDPLPREPALEQRSTSRSKATLEDPTPQRRSAASGKPAAKKKAAMVESDDSSETMPVLQRSAQSDRSRPVIRSDTSTHQSEDSNSGGEYEAGGNSRLGRLKKGESAKAKQGGKTSSKKSGKTWHSDNDGADHVPVGTSVLPVDRNLDAYTLPSQPAAEGVRRSGRRCVRPLKNWANQVLVYEGDNNGGESIVGVTQPLMLPQIPP